ncbi:MAG: undecaprenyl-phosphate glucose phosphotransferase [Bacteroidota bacterium]
MKTKHHDILIPFSTLIIDAIALECAFLFSYWIRFQSQLTNLVPVTEGVPKLESYLFSSLIFIPIWLYTLSSRGMYTTRRNTHISDEFFPIVRVLSLGMLLILSATFFYRDFSFSRVVFVLLWSSAILFVSIGRLITISFEKYLYKKGYELKNVAVVGSTDTAHKIMKMVNEKSSLGFKLCGYFSDENISSDYKNIFCGTIDSLPDFIKQSKVEIIFVALPYQDHPKLIELVQSVEGKNIDIMLVPDLIDLMTSRVRTQEIEGIPFIKIKEIPLTAWNRFLKRIFDFLFSLIVILLTLPIQIIIICAIKINSHGPIYFIQRRISVDGKEFSILKYRSMRIEAEEFSGPVRASSGDSRVTAIGKFLRRTSLDELPQLINVLMGEMSIVGPRPERPFFVEQFKNEIPRYLERHRLKSGLTGWAQVNGMRGDASISERTKYDIYYVENWSIAFDIKIIFKTIYAVIFGKDAY